jgi:microbial collagenase
VKKTKGLLCTSLIISTCLANAQVNTQQEQDELMPKAATFDSKPHLNHADNKALRTPNNLSIEEFDQLRRQNTSKDRHFLLNKTKNKASKNKLFKSFAASAVGCASVSELYTLTGQDLVDTVKASSLGDCLYGLYSEASNSEAFSDDKAAAIVEAMVLHLDTYNASDAKSADELETLVTYLRAMHYAQRNLNRTHTDNYNTSLNEAFTKYFSQASFLVFNGEMTRDFSVKREMLVLLKSSGSNELPFLERFTEALLGYANSVSQADNEGVYYEEKAIDELLTHFYTAITNKEADVEQLVLGNPNIIDNLKQFVEVDAKWLVGHAREWHWNDAINELGRYLRFGGTIAENVRPSIQAILSTYSHIGEGSKGWLNAQSAVYYNDNANCSLYGDVCDFDLQAAILSGSHQCGDTVKLRYQEPITTENLGKICQSIASQEQKFHSVMNTSNATPVEDDHNAVLEMIIFSSYTDYNNYGNDFFGINTDNGGYYLEGSPSKEGNQARFFAHQATWLADFSVWNLEHEFIHYLDGRFNQWGNFYEQAANSVWWGEGISEYLSQPNNNADALNVASTQEFSLSELFQTTYENSNTSRTYYWGYLAARFMMEEKRDQIENELLPSFRATKYEMTPGDCTIDWSWHRKTDAIENGWDWAYDDSKGGYPDWVWTCGRPANTPIDSELPEYTPYADILNNWGTSFDQEFSEWLTCIVAGNGECVEQVFHIADLDENNAIDKRDILMFRKMLRGNPSLSLDYDFNKDGVVDRRDVRPMMALCDLSRCAIAP